MTSELSSDVTKADAGGAAAPRRHRRLDRPRERVLEEAWQLLVERGLADLTLAELGRRVDTSAGHLLYYFGSKDEILLEVLRWSEEQLWERWAESLKEEMSFEARFDLFCTQFLPDAEGDPRWLVWIELWPRVLRSEPLRNSYDELDQVWRVALADLLAAEGIEVPENLARRICALLDGLSVAVVLGEPGLTAADAVTHARALLPQR